MSKIIARIGTKSSFNSFLITFLIRHVSFFSILYVNFPTVNLYKSQPSPMHKYTHPRKIPPLILYVNSRAVTAKSRQKTRSVTNTRMISAPRLSLVSVLRAEGTEGHTSIRNTLTHSYAAPIIVPDMKDFTIKAKISSWERSIKPSHLCLFAAARKQPAL